MVPKSIRSSIPQHIRTKILATFGPIYETLEDKAEVLVGRRDEFVPPEHLILASGIGGGLASFKAGRQFFSRLLDVAELKPYANVLEVGCGMGRMAGLLTRYLGQNGRYEGFDIVPLSIGWCQQKITRKYPNFRFRLANVYNRNYNPYGKFKANEYTFPYAAESFDLAILTSVFTHMLPEDFNHYVSEIARVLKAGGRCISTFLLLNLESLRLIGSGPSARDLPYETGPCRFARADDPEARIAYQEEYVRRIFNRSGLRIMEPIRYGWWPGREGNLLWWQDVVLAEKISRTLIQ